MHAHQLLRGQRGQQVDIAFDQRILGDQRERVPGFGHHLDQLAGDPQPAFDRLVGIGIDPQRDRLRYVARFGQLAAQHLGGIDLGEELGLEVQPRRQVQIGVRGPREAIRAAMFTAAVGIDRLAETHVRRAVAADDAARALLAYLSAQARRGELFAVVLLPAVVHRLGGGDLETPGQVTGRATAFDCHHHVPTLTPSGRSARDTRITGMKASALSGPGPATNAPNRHAIPDTAWRRDPALLSQETGHHRSR